MDHGINVVEFADRLMRFWGGSLVGIQSAKELEGIKRAEAEAVKAAKDAVTVTTNKRSNDTE